MAAAELSRRHGDLRAGQLVVDTEFLFSQYFSFFITSDWPTNPAVNIPSGGAAYPLSTPGIRLKVDPTPQTTVLLSVLNGDPAGPGLNDPEERNRYGLNFRVNDPPFVIGEFQYRYNQDPNSTALAGGVRFGGWHHFGSFDDLRFDSIGNSLASPLSTGSPAGSRAITGSTQCSTSNYTVRPAATPIPACCCSAVPRIVRPTGA